MPKPGDRHLTEEELDALFGLGTGSPRISAPANSSSERAVSHMSDCQECRQRVERLAAASRMLSALKSLPDEGPGSECPSREEWTKFAAGLSDRTRGDQLLDHAVACDHCGPFLKELMDDFSDSSSPEELAILSRLASSGSVWQSRLAGRLSATKPPLDSKTAESPASRTLMPAWRWAFGAVACLLLVGSAAWIFIHRPEAQVQRLIAEAYTERRTVPLRFSGAAFGQMRVERGSSSSFAGEPAPLLEAKGILARNLTKHSNDPTWLQASARADLLDWKYDAALTALGRALDIRVADSSLKIDTASALFERAEQSGHATDYGRAAELLSEVLTKQPDNSLALFNRAIVLERLFLFNEAVQDWQHYLRIDSSGPWSEEARHRLEEVRQKLEERRKESGELLLPSQVLAAQDPDSLVDSRIEDYLDVSVREWLPKAYPVGPLAEAHDRAQIINALRTVAMVLAERHNDTFLRDLLASSSDRKYLRAVAQLADAVRANGLGDQSAAFASAKRSEQTFLALRNQAGILRSQFEQLYAWQFYVRARDCSEKAVSLASKSESLHYAWLQAQYLLEKAFCANIDGNLGDARVFVTRARQVALNNRFHGLALRALVGMAGMEWEAGSVAAAWMDTFAGLQEFWAGHGSPLRGFTLYSVLDLISENDRRPLLQVAVIRESLSLPGQNLAVPSEAATRYRLANAALMAGLDDLAADEFRRAGELFAGSPDTEPTQHWRYMAAIGLARVELQHRRPDRALEVLQALPFSQKDTSDRLNSVDYFAALGEAQRELGNIAAAEEAFHVAIDACEQALNTLQDRRDRLTWSRECGIAYRPAVQLLVLRGDTAASFELWQAYRSLEARITPVAKKGRVPEHALQDGLIDSAKMTIQNRIQSLRKRTLLVYAVLPDGLAVWTSDDRGTNLHWVPSATPNLTRLASRFSDQCADPSSNANFLRSDGRALYELLIAPVVGDLTPERLLVVEPDDDMESIPFAALPDSSGHYMGARFTIVSSPGRIPAALSENDVALSRMEHVLVVAPGVSEPEKGLLPLEDANEEVRRVAAFFPAAILLAGSDATIEGIRRALPNASLFHYAGHSRVDVEGTRLLVTSKLQGSSVPLLSLSSQDFSPALLRNCRIAVLSACSTSRGEEGRWIDRESLVVAFLNAGVKRVVASRWSVDSRTTRRFMDEFYRHLLETKSVESALREAANTIRNDPATAHPFYWSSFEAFGSE